MKQYKSAQHTHLGSLEKGTHNPLTPSTSSKMSQLMTSTAPLRTFEDHKGPVSAVVVFPNKRQMVSSSRDTIHRLWDLETGIVLKKMEGHTEWVEALAVSRDGQIIASGDRNGEIIGWHGETGGSLTEPIKAHSNYIYSVDFSPDGTVLATTSPFDTTIKFWCTKRWQMQGEPIKCDACDAWIRCVRYSHLSRVTKHQTVQTGYSRGHPMARAFFQQAIKTILPYESGIH